MKYYLSDNNKLQIAYPIWFDFYIILCYINICILKCNSKHAVYTCIADHLNEGVLLQEHPKERWIILGLQLGKYRLYLYLYLFNTYIKKHLCIYIYIYI